MYSIRHCFTFFKYLANKTFIILKTFTLADVSEVLAFLLLFQWSITVMQTLFVWVLFLLIHIVISETGSMLKQGYSRIIYGHRLDGKTISSFAPISFLDCVEECLVRNRCQSVSYFKGANYCEIKYKDKLTAASSYQELAGWVYSEKGHWPQVNIKYIFDIFKYIRIKYVYQISLFFFH